MGRTYTRQDNSRTLIFIVLRLNGSRNSSFGTLGAEDCRVSRNVTNRNNQIAQIAQLGTPVNDLSFFIPS